MRKESMDLTIMNVTRRIARQINTVVGRRPLGQGFGSNRFTD